MHHNEELIMRRVHQVVARLMLATVVCGAFLIGNSLAQQKGGPAAADTRLALVPDDAYGFAVVRNLGEMDKKIGNVAQAIGVPAPPALMTLRSVMGIQEGLDEKGAIVVAIVPESADDPEPAPITFVPVTDYAKFIRQFQPADASAAVTRIQIANEESLVAKKGNFAVLSMPDHEATLKRVIAATKNVSTSVGPLSPWLAKQDIYGVILPKGIQTGIKPIRQGLSEAKQSFADNEQFRAIAGMMEMYDGVLSTVEKEITHVGVGLQIDDSGNVFLNSHSLFVANGSLQQAAAGVKTPSAPLLSQAPGGPFFFAFDGVMPEAWMETMAKFSAQAFSAMPSQDGEKLSDEEINKITEAMKESMRGMKSMAFVMGTMKPGQSMYDNMSAVVKVDDAKRYLANYEKSIAQMGKALEKSTNPVFKGYSTSKGEIDGIATLDVTMDMSAIAEQAGNDPNARKMMEMMFGREGKVTAHIGPADSTTVVMGYSKESFRRALDAVRGKGDTLGKDEDVAKAAKLLPKNSQWSGFFSVGGLIDFMTVVGQAAAPQGAMPQLPAFPDTPPIGFGATMAAKGCETSLVIPVETLQGLGQYGQILQGAGVAPGPAGPAQPPRAKQPR
jgi:hypothetical protein